jgi:hypothetical protein
VDNRISFVELEIGKCVSGQSKPATKGRN